jgi:uncharacterized protein YggE
MRTNVITAACVALAVALVPSAARAADTPATLAIGGVGIAFVTPDVATLSIGVRSTAGTRQGARGKANTKMRRVLAALAAQGVPRSQLTTTGVTLSRRQASKRKVVFVAENSASLRLTDVAKVGPVVDAATRAGADGIDGPYFSFADPSTGRAEATRLALVDARKRADDAAAAVGQRVTGIRSIVIDPASGPLSASGGDEASASSPAAFSEAREKTEVNAGRQEVTSTVEVVYTIAPV